MTDDGADPSAEHRTPIGSWRATAIGGEVVPAEVEVTASFRDDGRVNGRGGCNRYGGSFTLTGSEMAFGPIMSTRMACIGEGGRIEGRYLAALDAVTGWTIASNTLTLAGPAGSDAIVYERLDPASTVADEATVRVRTAGEPAAGKPAAGQPVDGED